MTTGVLSSGAYRPTNVGFFPIVQNAIPSYPVTGFVGTTVAAAINIPALSSLGVGPDAELIINVTWTCNSSANAKVMTASFGNIALQSVPWIDSQTTNTTNEWTFRVSARNDLTKQVVSASPFLGGSTNAVQNTTLDFTNPLYLSLYCTLANAADSVVVQRYSVYVSNPPVYTSPRANYPQKMFWGANAHWDDLVQGGGGITTAQVVACLQTLGMTTLRMAYENNAGSLVSLVAMAKALQGTGISLYCCLDLDMTAAGLTDEASAYARGWAVAQTVVPVLKPLGVTIYECGNELDSKNGINTVGDQGAYPASFSSTKWPLMRGIIAGAVDGVQKMGCLAASNAFVLCGIGASDMLWNGTNPNGQGGFRQVRWDITAWHNYAPWGSMVTISRSFQAPNMNLLEYIARAYQRPIMISEFNGQTGNTQAAQLSYWTYQASDYYANRYKYNIMGCQTYELFGGFPDWAMVQTPSTATLYTPFGTGIQTFIASNADSGT